MEGLFRKPPKEWTTDDKKAVVDIYKTLVDMADKVSSRRQSANSFYLSVNTALIGASAYLSTLASPSWSRVLMIAFAGLMVSALWIRNIQTYKDLNEGKFGVITSIEETLPIAPFVAEWEFLKRDKVDPKLKKYRQFHSIEVKVAYIMLAVHAMQFLINVPWSLMRWPF